MILGIVTPVIASLFTVVSWALLVTRFLGLLPKNAAAVEVVLTAAFSVLYGIGEGVRRRQDVGLPVGLADAEFVRVWSLGREDSNAFPVESEESRGAGRGIGKGLEGRGVETNGDDERFIEFDERASNVEGPGPDGGCGFEEVSCSD